MKERLCDNFVFDRKDLEKATRLTLFERVVLFFIKPRVKIDREENIKTVYKTFRGKIYIIFQGHIPPEGFQCRHIWNPKT